MSYKVTKSLMTEFDDCINANDSIDSEDQENDNVEIVVCAVVPDGETAGMDDLLLVDASLSKAYWVDVDDTEYTVIVDTNIGACAATNENTAGLDSYVVDGESIDEKNKHHYGYKGNEDVPLIERERSQDSDNQLWTNPDVCVREGQFTRWRKLHPFKHELEVSYTCNICGNCSGKFCENIDGCTFASDIPTLLHSTATRNVTENSTIREAYKETHIVLTENQNKMNKTLKSEKENWRPEMNTNTETIQTKIETAYSNSNTKIATKEIKINPKDDILYFTESEDDMAEEIGQLMEENKGKWGPLVEKKTNQSDETSVYETHRLEVSHNSSSCSENNISTISNSTFNETETCKVTRVEIEKQGNENTTAASNCKVRDNDSTLAAHLKRSRLKRHTESPDEICYSCDVCCQKFKWKSCLSRHMKIHGKIEYVSCKICSKEYTRKDSLYRHVNDVHFNQKKKSPKPGFCKICSKVFTRSDSVYRHMAAVHLNQKVKSFKTSKGFASLVRAKKVENASLTAKRGRAHLDKETKRNRR